MTFPARVRHPWLFLIVWSGVGLSLWLWRTDTGVAGWNGATPRAFTLFPSLARLLIDLAFAWLAGWAAVGILARIRGRRPDGAADRGPERAFGPLALLYLLAVPYVPGLAAVPAMLLIAGPLRWAILAAALASTAVGTRAIVVGRPPLKLSARGRGSVDERRRDDSSSPRTTSRDAISAASPPHITALAVGSISLLLYGAAAWHVAGSIGPGGDEPHYLVITHSLLHDHDLNVENNYKARDYRAFVGMDLPPHYLRRGRHGEIYSIHSAGLPVFVLPAYALGGYPVVVVFLVLLAAFGAFQAYGLAWDVLEGSPRRHVAALLGWAAVALTSPFLFHVYAIYPELPAGVFLVWLVRKLVRPAVPVRTAVVAGLAVASLPWLHAKFLLLAAILALIALVRWGPRRGLIPIGILIASIAAVFGYYYLLYGVADPRAPYGFYRQMSAATIPRGAAGLLFDQEYGLLPQSPAYALAFLGFAALARGARAGRAAAPIIGILVLALVPVVSAYYMWWAGASAPARFILPVLLLMAAPIAAGFASMTGGGSRATACTLTIASVALASAMLIHPAAKLMLNDRDGTGKVFERVSGPVDATHYLPSFVFASGRSVALTLFWIAAAVAITWWVRRLRQAVWAPAAMVIIVLATAAAIDLVLDGARSRWKPQSVRPFVERFTGDERFALEYPSGRRVPVGDALGQAVDLLGRTGPPRTVSGGLHLWILGGQAYVEPDGFWVGGGSAVRILVAPPSAMLTIVRVRNGLHPRNRVEVRTPSLEATKILAPSEEWSVAVPLATSRGEPRIAARISSREGFRPRDYGRPDDERVLGCFVTLGSPAASPSSAPR